MKNKKLLNQGIKTGGAVLFWIAVWWVGSLISGTPLLYPSPGDVLRALATLLGTREFYLSALHSLLNVTIGIAASVCAGVLLALLTWKASLLRDLLLPVMTVVKATPVASFIVLLMIWIGAVRVPSVITFLIVLPIVWANVDAGLSSVDRSLEQVTRVFGMNFPQKMKILILPTVKPYFLSACRSSLGLAWKAGIAAEIIAMPRSTVGSAIGNAKQYLETAEMFAWTVTVILLSLLIEFAVTALFGKSAKETRKEEGAV